MLNFFTVTAEAMTALDIVVLAEDKSKAEELVQKALDEGTLEFEDIDSTCVSSIYSHPHSCKVITEKEIKNEGVLCFNEGELDICYDLSLLEEMENHNEQCKREEWLKQNHMEFDFGQSK